MLEAVWILVFPSLITQFPLLITQKWWDPWRCSLFRFVFKYCFHHLILTFLSNDLTKLKTSFGCFWVMKTELWWHFCKYTHIWRTHGQNIITSGATFHNSTNGSFTPQIQPTQNNPTSSFRPPHAHPQPSHAYRDPPQPTRTTPSSNHSFTMTLQRSCNHWPLSWEFHLTEGIYPPRNPLWTNINGSCKIFLH